MDLGKQSRQKEQQTLDPEAEVCLVGKRISQEAQEAWGVQEDSKRCCQR